MEPYGRCVGIHREIDPVRSFRSDKRRFDGATVSTQLPVVTILAFFLFSFQSPEILELNNAAADRFDRDMKLVALPTGVGVYMPSLIVLPDKILRMIGLTNLLGMPQESTSMTCRKRSSPQASELAPETTPRARITRRTLGQSSNGMVIVLCSFSAGLSRIRYGDPPNRSRHLSGLRDV